MSAWTEMKEELSTSLRVLGLTGTAPYFSLVAASGTSQGDRDAMWEAAGSYKSDLTVTSGMLRFVEFSPHDEGEFDHLREILRAQREPAN